MWIKQSLIYYLMYPNTLICCDRNILIKCQRYIFLVKLLRSELMWSGGTVYTEIGSQFQFPSVPDFLPLFIFFLEKQFLVFPSSHMKICRAFVCSLNWIAIRSLSKSSNTSVEILSRVKVWHSKCSLSKSTQVSASNWVQSTESKSTLVTIRCNAMKL